MVVSLKATETKNQNIKMNTTDITHAIKQSAATNTCVPIEIEAPDSAAALGEVLATSICDDADITEDGELGRLVISGTTEDGAAFGLNVTLI